MLLMGPKMLALPKTEREVLHLVSQLEAHHTMPQCLGAVDGTHIEIKQPSLNPLDYLNRKQRYTLNAQACCDYRYVFMDVVVHWQGSVHDARVFSNSTLNKLLKTGGITPCPRRDGGDVVPVYLLGDPAYPLMPYLIYRRRVDRSGAIFWKATLQLPHGDRVCVWTIEGSVGSFASSHGYQPPRFTVCDCGLFRAPQLL